MTLTLAGGILTAPMPAFADTPAIDQCTDRTVTPYGSIGKWMLQTDGQTANWLGQTDRGRSIHEPINVLIVDRGATSPGQATGRLVEWLTAAGFPVRTGHSDGYRGALDGVVYQQQPAGTPSAFSNRFYLFENDHGRVFGPSPLVDSGYVWSAAFSRERPQVHPLTHVYVSFTAARDAVIGGLIGSGASDLGPIDLGNAMNTATVTTGDHDGLAYTVSLS